MKIKLRTTTFVVKVLETGKQESLHFIIIETAVNIEIIKSDLETAKVWFNIGNETACTPWETTQSFTFVNVTIMECKFKYNGIDMKAVKYSTALIQVFDTIMNDSAIEDEGTLVKTNVFH